MSYPFSYISRVVIVMYLILFIYQKRIQAQNNSSLSRNWVVGISPAVASCYGDLTQYDYDPYNKVIHESGPAVGLFAGKKINKILEVGLVATFGRTSGSQNNADIRFKNSFNEIGVYSGLNLAKILIPTQNSAIDYGIIAKYSITNYRAASYHISDNSVIASYGLNAAGNKSGNKESSLHFGGGYFFSYALNSRYTVQMSQIFQFLTTDKFDAFVGSTGVNDRLLLSTISLKYTIRPSQSAKIDLLECPTF